MEEKWKPLIYKDIDLTDRYEISNNGQLKSIKNNKILKMHINKQGYYEICISLGKRGKNKCIKPHIATAFMFIDGYKPGLIVNHKDGNKLNNNYTNLEWTTNKYNIQHAVKSGLIHYNKPIVCEQTGCVFNSIKEACEWCGLNTNGGSIWEYFHNPQRKTAGKHPVTNERLTWHLL